MRLAAVLALLALPAACRSLPPGRGEAPELGLPDASGRVRSLREFRGRTVLLDFWAPW